MGESQQQLSAWVVHPVVVAHGQNRQHKRTNFISKPGKTGTRNFPSIPGFSAFWETLIESRTRLLYCGEYKAKPKFYSGFRLVLQSARDEVFSAGSDNNHLPPRRPLRIFHITAIPNLVGIAKSKKLFATAVLQKKKMKHENIAYQGAQGKRATKLVAKPPMGIIHDYVPFYFAPRSPMLMAVDSGKVEDCPYRQADIAHLVTTVEAIAESELPYVFYDYNATLDIATCYSDLKDLIKIDWPLFYEQPCMDGYCQFWNSRVDNPKWVLRKETRQAEFLVHKSVPLDLISGVGVYSEEKAEQVREIFEGADIEIPVEVKKAWYY